MQPKRWWQSKTVLGALAALIATGVRALAPESEVAEGEILGVLTQVAQTAGMVVAIIGRFKASAPVITGGEAFNIKHGAAEAKLRDEWVPRGVILRVGIADEDIKQGAAVSIDGKGKVSVFREPIRGPGGELPGGTASP